MRTMIGTTMMDAAAVQPVAGRATVQLDFQKGGVRVWLSARRQGASSCTVDVQFETDHDQARPPGWEDIPRVLAATGYSLLRPMDGSEEEQFCPTSFFSAQAMIAATKDYGFDQAAGFYSDWLRLVRCVDRPAARPAGTCLDRARPARGSTTPDSGGVR